MSREQWDALVEASEAHALTLTLPQRNTIAETAAYLEAIEEQNDLLRKENTQLRQALQQIAGIAGNLSDEAIQRVGGFNDARRWALAVVHAREIAKQVILLH